MTTTYPDTEPVAGHPYATPDFGSLPQTPHCAPDQSVWTQLSRDFARLCRTGAARTEYARWRERHSWRADTPSALVADLRDDPHGLGAVVAYYQDGSKLAAAILAEAFRPALITFTRYARIDDCEQIDRPEVRAQCVLVTFYDVASTTDPQSLSIAGRLYGETLKRVTLGRQIGGSHRERPRVSQFPASGMFLYETWDGGGTHQNRTNRADRSEDYFRPATVDIAPVAAHPQLDWEAIERKGLARDVVTMAHDAGVISEIEYDLVCGRFLGDSLVPVPTLARSLGKSVSYCESKLRRALEKMSAHYTRGSRAAAVA